MAWLSGLKNYKKGGPGETHVDAAIGACRAGRSDDRLSNQVHDRILSEALRGGPTEEPFPAVFTPTRRLLIAGTLPLILAVVLLVGIDGAPQSPPAPGEDGPRVAVVKHGDHVVFNIENGKRRHVVYRSTDPVHFERASGVSVTDGAYHDGLQDQADLVFYRID
jgi:hypothetical protein